MKAFHPYRNRYSPLPILRFFLLLFVSFAICGCGREYDEDPRLRRVAAVLSAPELSRECALAMHDTLKAISPEHLTEEERHYRDFLMIKSADKGYLIHQSDSLYITVKDYFSSNYREMMPEVLYYGGRVYSDMGVYPVALQYFQDALAHMDDKQTHINLRRRALGQIGGLLTTLGLYGETLPYVEESISLTKTDQDTLAWIYDLMFAGDVTDRMKDYTKAVQYFNEAVRLSEGRAPKENVFGRFRLGKLSWARGDSAAAIHAFEATMKKIAPEYRNYALPVVAQVWREAGDAEKACSYARELVENPDPLNKKIGYNVLVSPGIRERLHPDTLNTYVLALDSILIDRKKETMAETARLQHTVYNYNLHDRARRNAEKERDRLKIGLLVAAVIVMVLILVFIWMAFQREKARNRSIRTMAKRKIIERSIAKPQEDLENAGIKFAAEKLPPVISKEETDCQRNYVKETVPIEEKILSGEDNGSDCKVADERTLLLKETEKLCMNVNRQLEWKCKLTLLRKSETYKRLLEALMLQKGIGEGNQLWLDLSRELDKCYPGFIDRLRILAENKLTVGEEQTAMLVKAGFGLKEIAILLGRAKGTIGSRRTSIGSKIFNDKRGVGMVDLFLKVL